MKKTMYITMLVILVAVGVFTAGCSTNKIPTGNNAQGTQLSAKAPTFNLKTISGETVSSEAYLASGKPTIVYFMASWCPTCAKNWPSLNKLYTNYGDKVNIVAVSIDPTDTQDVLTKLANDKGLIFPMVAGNPQLMIDFGVKGQATTVGFEANGNIVFIKAGEFSFDQYKSMVESLL